MRITVKQLKKLIRESLQEMRVGNDALNAPVGGDESVLIDLSRIAPEAAKAAAQTAQNLTGEKLTHQERVKLFQELLKFAEKESGLAESALLKNTIKKAVRSQLKK